MVTDLFVQVRHAHQVGDGEEGHQAHAIPEPALQGLEFLPLDTEIRRRSREDGLAAPEHVPVGGEARQVALDLSLAQGRVEGRKGEVGSPLEDGDLGRLLGDQRDGLDGRRTGADHGHPLAGEVDALMGPKAGQVGLAPEAVSAGNVR